MSNLKKTVRKTGLSITQIAISITNYIQPIMSKDKPGRDKKKLPNPVGKGAPSDYQSGKKTVSKIDIIPKKK